MNQKRSRNRKAGLSVIRKNRRSLGILFVLVLVCILLLMTLGYHLGPDRLWITPTGSVPEREMPQARE